MPKILSELLLSKKFVVALLTSAGSVAAYLGWGVDTAHVVVVVAPILAFLGAQGWADSGKEAAKFQLEAAKMSITHGADMERLRLDHEVRMENLRARGGSGLDGAPGSAPKIAVARSPQTGSATLGAMLVIMVTGAAIAGAVIAGSLAGACSHPGQVTLKANQCVLDHGVLGRVIAALGQKDYVAAIGSVALAEIPDVIDCALQAVASEQAPSSGLPKAVPGGSLAQRAREVIELRRAGGQPAGDGR